MANTAPKREISTLLPIRESLDRQLRALAEFEGVQQRIKSAILHSFYPPGKLIRPLLLLSISQDLTAEHQKLLDVALAVELLHVASLVHDDLPAIDGDTYRRGRLTCHAAFGEATAVLAGDTMVALAFQLLSRADIPPEAKNLGISTLSTAFVSLCNGQQLDLRPEASDVLEIHREKTGALFAASITLGSLTHINCAEHWGDFRSLGLKLGEAFQLGDDLIDCFGSAEQRGRPESSDQRNNKDTFFVQGEVEQGKEYLLQSINTVYDKLSQIEFNTSKKFYTTRELLAEVFLRFESV